MKREIVFDLDQPAPRLWMFGRRRRFIFGTHGMACLVGLESRTRRLLGVCTAVTESISTSLRARVPRDAPNYEIVLFLAHRPIGIASGVKCT